MSKTVYVTVEALIKLFNEDYDMRLPKNTRFILTSESNKEKEQSYIADLETKLAEKEKAVDGLQEINQSLGQTCNNDAKEIERLRELITEKEKEIANLKGLVRERDKQIKNLKTNKKRVIEHKNKTKINFAIEQLEKVKEEFISEDWDLYDTSDLLEQVCELRNEQIKFIDNQIKQLKETK